MHKLISVVFLLLFTSAAFCQPSENIVFKAFKQGKIREQNVKIGGNCVAVAIIKAGIATFGLNNTFLSVQRDSAQKLTRVILRDGTMLTLTFAEEAMARTRSRFVQKKNIPEAEKDSCNKVMDFAQFCFAVLCKNKQMKDSDLKSYNEAIRDVNISEPAVDAYQLMGFYMQPVNIDPKEMYAAKNILIYNGKHCVYASNGLYDEQQITEPAKLSDFEKVYGAKILGNVKHPIKGAYKLR